MSVFATRIKTKHVRNLTILVALCAIVIGVTLSSQIVLSPLMATIRNAVVSPTPFPHAVPKETVFPQPRAIDWEGMIVGVLAGGKGLAIERTHTGEMFQAYGAQGQIASVSEGLVRVIGRWTGISCAYQQTVFGGRCTPTVDFDVLEILPITLE